MGWTGIGSPAEFDGWQHSQHRSQRGLPGGGSKDAGYHAAGTGCGQSGVPEIGEADH